MILYRQSSAKFIIDLLLVFIILISSSVNVYGASQGRRWNPFSWPRRWPTFQISRELSEPSFPWAVSIQKKVRRGWTHRCSGCLIGSQWVLTSAECISSIEATTEHRIAIGKEHLAIREPFEVYSPIKDTFSHPLFQNNIFDPAHNFGLIQLGISVSYSHSHNHSNIATIPLGLFNATDGSVNRVCRFAKWGPGKGNYLVSILQKATVIIMSSKKCAEQMMDVTKELVSSLICTIIVNKVRLGSKDSGAGLECKYNDKYVLVGTMSGFVNDSFRMPLFTSVRTSLEWINTTMINFGRRSRRS